MQVEQALRELLARRALVAQPAHEQDRVQADHLQPTVAAVGHAPVGVEDRLAGLVDQGGVEPVRRRRAGALAPEAAEQRAGARTSLAPAGLAAPGAVC